LFETDPMLDSSGSASLDLVALGRIYRSGARCPRDILAWLPLRLGQAGDRGIWIRLVPQDLLLKQACDVEKRHAAGERLPLYGAPFAVKDNIDVAEHPTTAGCPAFASVPDRSAPVVANLIDAGAIFVGKTNMDQFACGLAGDRSPFGACRNAFDRDRISGGSSSGSAVAVAAGLVSFALATDTAGSGRVPAGCNNIVGLKPSPGVLSNEGMVPACASLDCVSIMALTAADALRVCEVAAGRSEPVLTLPEGTAVEALGRGWTFAVPRASDLEFFGDDAQENLYRQALVQLGDMGGERIEVDFHPFREVASLLYEGPWLAERWAPLKHFLQQHSAAVHPVTRSVLEGGASITAADAFEGLARLESLRLECGRVFDEADMLVVPTMPTLPRLDEVEANSALWSQRLGHYTNFVNLLRWAALAVPSGFTSGGLPGGITLIGPGGSDRQLCRFGMAWQRQLSLPLGATGQPLPHAEPCRGESSPYPPPAGYVRVAVAGAHLRGQPLHADLRRTGARFVRACRTAAGYRFLALLHLDPPRPGLLRDKAGRGAIAVEIYDVPTEGFGRLVASVAPPLAIGTIELAGGETVKGFLCESFAAAAATDITDTGGWLAFRNRHAPGGGGNA
jgi:allophanate hydrolase